MRPRTLRLAAVCATMLWPAVSFAADAGEHAEAPSAGGLPPLLTPDKGMAIWTLILFAVVLIVLGKFVWPTIVKALDLREQKIRDDIASAQKANADAQKMLGEYKAKLAEAHAEARKLADQARADAETLRTKLVADAEAEGTRLRQRAADEITQAKNQAVQDIYAQTAEIAVAVAGKILQRQIDATDTQQLVDQSLAELSNIGRTN